MVYQLFLFRLILELLMPPTYWSQYEVKVNMVHQLFLFRLILELLMPLTCWSQ